MRSDSFQRYVALAAEGRNGVGSIVLGLLIIIAVWIAATFATAALVGFAVAVVNPEVARDPDFGAKLMTGRTGAIILLSSIGALWFGVRLALRYVHRRRFDTVLGAEMHIIRSDVVRGAVAALAVGIAMVLLGILIDGMPPRGPISMAQWLLWLIPMLALLLLQTSAEEVAFRGYLTQALAQRFRSPAIWAGVPTVIFALLHWYTDANGSMNAAILAIIAALAASMTLLVYLTGNLGAAMGVHWGNNIAALLLFSNAPEMNGIALYQFGSLSDASLTAGNALQLGAVGVFSILATIMLLVHPRSPLRLRGF